jgi:predicted lysophospholipase L1 biosynthesis ABC-type transport system permease subunit
MTSSRNAHAGHVLSDFLHHFLHEGAACADGPANRQNRHGQLPIGSQGFAVVRRVLVKGAIDLKAGAHRSRSGVSRNVDVQIGFADRGGVETTRVEEQLQVLSLVRRQALAIDPDQPVFSMRTMERRLAESVAPRRFQMLLFGVFAAVALALAAVGIYGVMAHSVSLRAHEIGIRMALGAKPRDVLRMVVAQGMRLALIGLAIGLTGAFALTRVMASLLFNVSPADPATFTSASALLAVIAFLATYLPARRATKVDPMIALRHE